MSYPLPASRMEMHSAQREKTFPQTSLPPCTTPPELHHSSASRIKVFGVKVRPSLRGNDRTRHLETVHQRARGAEAHLSITGTNTSRHAPQTRLLLHYTQIADYFACFIFLFNEDSFFNWGIMKKKPKTKHAFWRRKKKSPDS